jgi:hypothetical protein
MSISKIVRVLLCLNHAQSTDATFIFVDVSRPDRLSSADIASIVQGAGLQGMYILAITDSSSFSEERLLLAVRKNRYVILPIDFEEAWKVSQLPCVNSLSFHVWLRLLITCHTRVFASSQNSCSDAFSFALSSRAPSSGQTIRTSSVRRSVHHLCVEN